MTDQIEGQPASPPISQTTQKALEILAKSIKLANNKRELERKKVLNQIIANSIGALVVNAVLLGLCIKKKAPWWTMLVTSSINYSITGAYLSQKYAKVKESK